MALTKVQIAEEIYLQIGGNIRKRYPNILDDLSKKRCIDSVEIFLEIMKKTMEKGEDVLVSGFKKF